jgi:hypothetical protein
MQVFGMHNFGISTTRLAIFAAIASACALDAGSYAPAAGEDGSTAVYKDDSSFIGWATSVVDYEPGTSVDDDWKDTSLCLGTPDEDGVYGITCLGNGGTITVSFDHPIANGDGWDFAVFENGFSDGFLELAYVEVSSDGKNFVRFPNHSETASHVGAYANTMDATCIDGLAGKYRLAYGTPFDLSDLEDVDGAENVDLDAITEVRLVDIIGDGTYLDSDGNPIYDPYPTIGSGGFDLDAMGVRYFQTTTVSSAGTSSSGVSIKIDGDNVSIIWNSSSGVKYEVQYSTDLVTWKKLRNDISGTGSALMLGTAFPTVPTFYRVVKE